ncbi:MAG: hypothetical protein LBC43_01290 [Bifidobacteriaceae bacterium]|jgi:hypothetical protein|nr:hypothetical protein [Bifidobacteriaceae bacterium]
MAKTIKPPVFEVLKIDNQTHLIDEYPVNKCSNRMSAMYNAQSIVLSSLLDIYDLGFTERKMYEQWASVGEGALVRNPDSEEFVEEMWVKQTIKRFFQQAPKSNDWQILYFDMDNVLVDFYSGVKKLPVESQTSPHLDEVENIFALMEPMPGALAAAQRLSSKFDTHILSTSPWKNMSGATQKLQWIEKHFAGSHNPFYKKVTLTHHKELSIGGYLIDDQPKNGADKFRGKWIHFGSPDFPDWEAVEAFLELEYKIHHDIPHVIKSIS